MEDRSINLNVDTIGLDIAKVPVMSCSFTAIDLC